MTHGMMAKGHVVRAAGIRVQEGSPLLQTHICNAYQQPVFTTLLNKYKHRLCGLSCTTKLGSLKSSIELDCER